MELRSEEGRGVDSEECNVDGRPESWSNEICDLDSIRCKRSNVDNRVSIVPNRVWRIWRRFRTSSQNPLGSSTLGSVSVENAKGGVRSNETGAVSDEYAVDITSAEFDDFLSGLLI